MPSTVSSYQQKFEKIASQTCYGLLSETEREFVRGKAEQLRFTQQELRLVSEMSLDRARWKELPLSSDWPRDFCAEGDRNARKRLLSQLEERHTALRSGDNDYSGFDHSDKPVTEKPVLNTKEKPVLGLGRCPVASERTRCCNLLTLDAVEKCGFDCSYCSIQSFYHGNEVVFDGSFAEKLSKLELDPDKTWHIGTGQSSDSLMWGNHQGVLEAVCNFARRNPNVILELKTKSKNIGWLLENHVPANVVCTWSLNPQPIIDHEEHLSASLDQRLVSARRLADKGIVVGFHFHPIIRYQGWRKGYAEICDRVVAEFDPEQVAMVSMGTLTFTPSVMKTIRKRNLTSKILQLPLEPSAGKLSYPEETKIEMFRHVYQSLEAWHQKVFFYLCMEPAELWHPVFGFDYANNSEFEDAMKSGYMEKIRKCRHSE